MIEERILLPILERYFGHEDLSLMKSGWVGKERVASIGKMEIVIYSWDHNPPHFHVRSKDGKIDAKFLIENGDFMSGVISTKDEERIKAFYSDIKTRMVMEMIWNKRNA